MKYLIIILSFIILSSCLTERRFNKVLTKGIEKGWIDTSTKAGNYVYIPKVDTNKIENKIKNSIETVLKDTTIYKDTCYNKSGKVIGKLVDTTKLKKKLQKTLKDTILPEIVHCLKKPIFIKDKGITVEIYQDSLGVFKIKTSVKDTTITRPQSRSWYQRYVFDVWFLYLIIGILILVIALRR